MDGGEGDRRDVHVRRPMNAFLIFCKGQRSIVREKNPDLDNRGVTKILGDLWANLKEEEKIVYTDFAKQYKDAFMKANPDFRWHRPKKSPGCQKSRLPLAKQTNAKMMQKEVNMLPERSILRSKLAEPSVSIESMSQCVLCENAGSDTEMKSLHKALVMQGNPDGFTFEHALESDILSFSSLAGKYCLSCLQACERVSKIKRNIEDLMSRQTLTGHDLSNSCKRKAASEITFPENNMKRSRMGEENAESQVQLCESEPTRLCLADVKIEPEYETQTQANFESNTESPNVDHIEFEVHINPDYFVKEEPEDEIQTHKEVAESQAELPNGFSTETCTADVKKEPGLEIETHMNEDNDSRRLSAVGVTDQPECQSQVTGVNVPLTEGSQKSSLDEGRRQPINQMQSQISGVNLSDKVQLLQFTPTNSCEAQGKMVFENQMQNQKFGVNCVNKVPFYTLIPANSFTSEGNTVPANQTSGVNSVNRMQSVKLIGTQSVPANQISGVNSVYEMPSLRLVGTQSLPGNQISGVNSVNRMPSLQLVGTQSVPGNQISGVNSVNRMPSIRLIGTQSVPGNQISGENSVNGIPSIRLIGTQSVPGNQISGVNSVNRMPSIRLIGTQSVPGNQISGVNLTSRMPLLRIIPTSSCIAERKTVPGNQMSVGQLTHTSTLPENQMQSAVSTVSNVSNKLLFRLIPTSSVKGNEEMQHEIARVNLAGNVSGSTAESVVADQNKLPENKIQSQISGENLFPNLALQLQKQSSLLAGNIVPANQIQMQMSEVNFESQMQVEQQQPGSNSAHQELVKMQPTDVYSASQKQVQQLPSVVNSKNLKKVQKQTSGVNSSGQKQVQVQQSSQNSGSQKQVQVQKSGVNSSNQKQEQVQTSGVNSSNQKQEQVQPSGVNSSSQKQEQVQQPSVRSSSQEEQVQVSSVNSSNQKQEQVQPSSVNSSSQRQEHVQQSGVNPSSQKQVQVQQSGINSSLQNQVQVQPYVVNFSSQNREHIQPSGVDSLSQKQVQDQPSDSSCQSQEQVKTSGVNSSCQNQEQVKTSGVNSSCQSQEQVKTSGVNSSCQNQEQVKTSGVNSSCQSQEQVKTSGVNSSCQSQEQVKMSGVNSSCQSQEHVKMSGENSLCQSQEQVKTSGVNSSCQSQEQVKTSGVNSSCQKQQPGCIKDHQMHRSEKVLEGQDSRVNCDFFSTIEKQQEKNIPHRKDVNMHKGIINRLMLCKNFDDLVIFAFRIKLVRNYIEEKILREIDRACEDICCTDQLLGHLLKFDLASSGKMDINIFDKIIQEMQKTVPFLTRVLRTVCLNPSFKPSTKYTVVMMFAMGMHVRNPNMSYLQQLNTCLIDEYDNAELLNLLSKFSFTLNIEAKEMFVQRMKKLKPGLLANIAKENETVDRGDDSAVDENSKATQTLPAYLFEGVLPAFSDKVNDEEFTHFMNKVPNCSDLVDFVELALDTKEIKHRMEYELLREIDGSCEAMCIRSYQGRDLSIFRDDLAAQDKINRNLFETIGQEVMERNPFLYNVLKTMCTAKPTTSCTLAMIFAMGIRTRCPKMSYLQQLNTILLGQDRNFYLLNMLCKLNFTLNSFAQRSLLRKKKELKAQFLADADERDKKLSKVQLFHSLLPTANKFNTEKKNDSEQTTHNTEDANEREKKLCKVQLFHSLLPPTSDRNTNKLYKKNDSEQITHNTEDKMEQSSTKTQTKANTFDTMSSDINVIGDPEDCTSTSKEIVDANSDITSSTTQLDEDAGRSSVAVDLNRQTNSGKKADLSKSQCLNPVVQVRPEERKVADDLLNKVDSKQKERKRAGKDCTAIKLYYETAKIMADAEYGIILKDYKTMLMSITSPATTVPTRHTKNEESSHGGTQGGKTCRALILIVEQYEKLLCSIGRSEITPGIRDNILKSIR